DSVTSVEGSTIRIDCSDGFEVKNATVIAADIEADNGIIHVIDNVILMG
ncbi:MAG: fasciclin domain-containing protein, partial [Leptolyngbyaceae cyanobacterium SM1_3_5]|nr:fasciclin domain-containing protein [Leptolyngbyaceae cyanobacterium SM1_3_5]